MRHPINQIQFTSNKEEAMEHPRNLNPNQSERGGIMEKSITRKIHSLLLTLILMVTVLWVGSVVAAEKEMVTDPTTGKMVSAPGVWRDIHLGRCARASAL